VVNLKEWMMILELHQQGLTVSAIAERTGHDRKTVRKVIERGLVVPTYAARTPRPTRLGPYEAYLRERVAAWPELSGVRLLREVRERGYAGGVTQLNDFLRAVRPPVVAPFEVRFETPWREGDGRWRSTASVHDRKHGAHGLRSHACLWPDRGHESGSRQLAGRERPHLA
jgi:hypothetical protein